MSAAATSPFGAEVELRRWRESHIAAASAGPLDPERARRALADGPLLPVKPALADKGALVLQAELPRVGARDERALVERALEAGWDRLDAAERDVRAPRRAARDEEVEAVESVLACLPGAARLERTEDGGFRVSATALGAGARVDARFHACGALHVATRAALAVAGARAPAALAGFALEANRRLPLARIALRTGGERADLCWEAVVPAGLEIERALPAAAEAVLAARAHTWRALRALTHDHVARAYRARWAGRASHRPKRRLEEEGGTT